MLPEIKSPFLKQWLEYTANTESPPLFHIWTALSCTAAALGHRVQCSFGAQTFYPNMYVVLCGPPAVRKSSSAKLGVKLLKQHTSVKFGPSDTGGQRQGMYAAWASAYGSEDAVVAQEVEQVKIAAAMTSGPKSIIASNDALADFMSKPMSKKTTDSDKDTPKDLFIFADELSRFIGVNMVELINLLTEVHSMPDFVDYQLAKSKMKITYPALNLLACTTPTSLTKHLPPTSVGDGFGSRAVFVYQGSVGKKIFPVPLLDIGLGLKLGNQLSVMNAMEGDVAVGDDVEELLTSIYDNYRIKVEDSRFAHYEMRRLEHLIKISINIACANAADGLPIMTVDDVMDAHLLLQHTEQYMTHALGELGVTQISIAKQQMKEMIINSAPHGVSRHMLKMNMLRDMRNIDFEQTLNEFSQKKICIITKASGSKGEKYELILPYSKEVGGSSGKSGYGGGRNRDTKRERELTLSNFLQQ